MKGIVLAGGAGTRLYPLTLETNKHLLPVFDKPMIYYPLSVLMLSGITEILIISNPHHIDQFKRLLGNGDSLGMRFEYASQDKPRGLADAFIVGEEFIGNDDVTLILGDNIFYGDSLSHTISNAIAKNDGATVFAYHVANPSQFGVVNFDREGNALSLEEKPKNPSSSWAVTGIYIYDNNVIEIARSVEPSARGEIEITSINNEYLNRGKLQVQKLSRGIAWLDTGTPEDLQEAGQFMATIEKRQGLRVGCIEEIAFSREYINQTQFKECAENMPDGPYAQYLKARLVEHLGQE